MLLESMKNGSCFKVSSLNTSIQVPQVFHSIFLSQSPFDLFASGSKANMAGFEEISQVKEPILLEERSFLQIQT